MGSILFMTGHVDQALANMAEALRADPKYAHAYWDRGHLLFNARQDYRGALADFQAFSRSSPPVRMPTGRAP
jgi:tetratricopeptide (TPR) repeat protein